MIRERLATNSQNNFEFNSFSNDFYISKRKQIIERIALIHEILK